MSKSKKLQQTKLPARFRRASSSELTFRLKNDGLAEFREERSFVAQDGERFLWQIKWPDLGQLMNLSCDSDLYQRTITVTTTSTDKNQSPDWSLDSTWLSILKSHLQKAVRRQETESALATTQILLREDPISLLRRLPIIVVEDTFLFSQFPTLVWLMVYYSSPELSNDGQKNEKGLVQISQYWSNWILQVVQNLCQRSPVRDQLGVVEKFNWSQEKLKLAKLESGVERNLIYSLQLRRSYGGMNCDQRMLNWFSQLWLNRFTVRSDEDQVVINELNRDGDQVGFSEEIKEVEVVLKRDNFILAGIDFHCCPWMIKEIKGFEAEEIKSLIWRASSSFNSRVMEREDQDLNQREKQIWEQIKDDWRRIANRILNLYLSD